MPLARRNTVLAALAFWAVPAIGLAQTWQSLGGPPGGLGYDLRLRQALNSVMFASDNHAGVAISTDSGATWKTTNAGITVRGGKTLDDYNIFSLTIDPNDPSVLWAGTQGEGTKFGVFKSTDGGTNWKAKTAGIAIGSGSSLVFRGFTVQPGNSQVVYAQAEVGTPSQGREFNRTQGRIYKTTNGGDSWSLVWSGESLARYLIIHPTDGRLLYASTGIFDREASNSDCGAGKPGGVGVLKSTDGGAHWMPVNNGLTDLYVGSLRMHPRDPAILMAAAGNNACSEIRNGRPVGGVFRSASAGADWKRILDDAIYSSVAFAPSNPDIVYAAGANVFARSTDGGVSFTRVRPQGSWGPPGVRVGIPIDLVVDADNPDIVYASAYGIGVVRSIDAGKTWSTWSSGYTGAILHRVRVHPLAAQTLFTIGRSGPYVSRDSGKTWTGVATPVAAGFAEWASIAADPGNPANILLADEFQGAILRSTDGGASFREVLREPGALASNVARRQGFKALEFASSAIVYAGLSTRRNARVPAPIGTVVYKSTDGGGSWKGVPSAVDGKSVNELVIDPGNVSRVFAATSSGVFLTKDGAATWALAGLSGKKVEGLALDPRNPNRVIAGVYPGGIYVSSDGGATWAGPANAGFNSGTPSITSVVFDRNAADVVYAADAYGGVFRSVDGGKRWAAFPGGMAGLAQRSVTDLAIDGATLFAATEGGGLFRFPLGP